jgi:hypothetical protein
MQKWNPFKRHQIPYHQMLGSKEFTEASSDNGEGPSAHPPSDDVEYYTTQALHRPRRSLLVAPWCTVLIALTSLLLGLISGQFLRAEHTIDGYLRTSPAYHVQPPAALVSEI